MSSDSESFTSHSGSIENQLMGALENGNAANSGLLGHEQTGALRNHGNSGGFDPESPDHSLSDELPRPEDGGPGADAGQIPGAAWERPQERGQQQQQQQHQQYSDENLDDGAAGTNQSAINHWAINSPHVESAARPEGREFELRSLSRQLCKKSARRGFDFKLMLVGESGIGKTTLIDSLFNVESTRNLGSQFLPSHRDATTTTKLCERFFELEEGGVSVRLTVIDTPGFAAELDSSGCVQPVLGYVERQLDEYYRLEQGTDRSKLQDGRVHALLYMISPSSRGLKQVDLMCLKALHSRVNIVPVIGKADTLTPSELSSLKTWIQQDLSRHGISVYTLPEFEDCFGQGSDSTGDDFYLRNQYESLRNAMPLAVVGSSLLVQTADGSRIRAREYPWGVVDIDNPEYSDFLKLRELLIMYMEDFKDRTHEVIYEQIRLNKLRQTDWQMSRMTKTLVDRERLLREKEEELSRLREAVEGLQQQQQQQQRASGGSKSSSLPAAASQSEQPSAAARVHATAPVSARPPAAGGGGGGFSAAYGGQQHSGAAHHGRGRSGRYSQYD